MKKLNLKWVTDTVDNDYKSWQKGDIILLGAQTGTGKTTFIKDKLINYLNYNDKLLYICNRTNLKRQFKMDLLEKFNKPIPETMEELDEITYIGNVVITSYHAIQFDVLNEIYDNKKVDFNAFKYIILDECHYILADGNFNNKTRFAFNKLVDNDEYKGIKIFISATMQELKLHIEQIVYAYNGDLSNIKDYTTGIDYSYVHPKYFTDIKIVISLIKNDMTNQKWLIFVSNLKDGNDICKELGDHKCSLIKAGTKDNPELTSIITKGVFEKKVLVCTKALDNGINIKDDALTNIVIMTWDYITFIQMLGRKRIDIDNAQQINLYIPTRYKKSFTSLLKKHNEKLNEVILLDTDRTAFNKKYDNDLKDLNILNSIFYRNNNTGEYEVNPIGYYRLNKDIEFAKCMIKKFKDNKQFAFIQEQLSWLGLEDYNLEENLISNVIIDELKQSLEEYLENLYINQINLFDSEQKKLKDFITKDFDAMVNKLNGRHKDREPTANIINKLLVMFNIPYFIDNTARATVDGKQQRCWIIQVYSA